MAAAYGGLIFADNTANGASTGFTSTGAVNAGERIVLVISGDSDVTVTGVTDPNGNTYAIDEDFFNGAASKVHVVSAHSAAGIASSSAWTITFSGSTDWVGVIAFTLTGVASASAVASTNSVNDGGAYTTTATAAGQDDAIIIGATMARSASDFSHTAGTNFTEIAEIYSDARANLAAEYRVITVAGDYAASGTWSGDDFGAANAHVIYKGAGGAAPVLVVPPIRRVF
jgi:hypothetical protein